MLDEDEAGVIDAAPAAEFVRRLPALSLRPLLDRTRSAEIADLAASLSQVTLGRPGPFTSGELHPDRASTDERVWPFPDAGRRLLADQPVPDQAGRRATAQDRHRPDAGIPCRVARAGRVAEHSTGGTSTCCNDWPRSTPATTSPRLATAARRVPRERTTDCTPRHSSSTSTGGQSMIVTGSANLTSADVGHATSSSTLCCIGPTSACGVEAVLNGSPEAPGLSRILEEYTRHRRRRRDGSGHRDVVRAGAVPPAARRRASRDFTSTQLDDDRVDGDADTRPSRQMRPGETRVWLVVAAR